MPKFDIFDAHILVNNVERPEYNVLTDEHAKTVTCWIQSEVGKAFSVCWKNLALYSKPISGKVFVDGMYTRGHITRENISGVKVLSDIRVTPTTSRSLMFAELELTDDDTFLNLCNVEKLGDICLELWEISVVGRKSPHRQRGTLPEQGSKVHEKVKKGMAHRVTFGEEKSIPPSNGYYVKRIDRLVTFIFKYRSMDILRADGIVAPVRTACQAGAGKRKADAVEDEEVDDGIEEQAEAELKALLEKANQIQSMLAKRAAKLSTKNRKRVKTEDRPAIISGEVIDLT